MNSARNLGKVWLGLVVCLLLISGSAWGQAQITFKVKMPGIIAYELNLPTLVALANGYFLEIGENGTADGLRFFRQKDGAAVLLTSGPASTLGSDPAVARIHVVRKTGGFWKIGADFSGGEQFLPQMEFSENELPGGQILFFGLDCLFSATRKDKFFFVPKAEIVENEYDLSISKYKEEVYEEVIYCKPEVIFEKLENIESNIQKGIAELKELLK